MLPVFAGLALGIIAARSTSRLAAALLFDVSPLDLTTYALTVALLTGAAMVACYLPARRTLRIEPMSILKSE
jgi:putative ABC transport system permease protein